LKALNARGRVSNEVLSLHLVHPSLASTMELCETLRKDPRLSTVEHVEKLRPNNGLRDLLNNRLPPEILQNYMLVVGIETVTEKFRNKYPYPNLTLQAGSIEKGESILNAAVREVFEESRIMLHWTSIHPQPIRLLGGGLIMFLCMIDQNTLIRLAQTTIYIGYWNASPETWIHLFHNHIKTNLRKFRPPYRHIKHKNKKKHRVKITI
jgi:hypothetical protein